MPYNKQLKTSLLLVFFLIRWYNITGEIMKKRSILLVLGLVLIDRIIKYLVTTYIAFNGSVKVIDSFFYLTNILNSGAAWSILRGNRFFLIFIAIASLIVLYYIMKSTKKMPLLDQVLYSILSAGIIGNLIDRIFYGGVIDYLEFIIFKYNFPIFNFSDILIVISIIFISYRILKEGEPSVRN